MDINQRVSELIKELGLTAQKFAESVNTNALNITHITNNRSKPGYVLLCEILRTYRDVSPYWLLLGEGEMFLSSIEQNESNNSLVELFSPIVPELSQQEHILEQDLHTAAVELVQEQDKSSAITTSISQSIEQDQSMITKDIKHLEKVVLLYSDGSFEEFVK